jgi:hypothetical protein
LGSLSLCRSLLRAGLVDRFRVVMFPVIAGATGAERIYDGYPDVALEMIASRTFDDRIQLVEYRPRGSSTPPRHHGMIEEPGSAPSNPVRRHEFWSPPPFEKRGGDSGPIHGAAARNSS